MLAANAEVTTENPSASERGGMGAVPYEEGVTFRVWAPNADAVTVMGSFNDWNGENTPLASEDNGYWSVDVPGAHPGDEYKFVLTNDDHTFSRVDPYARQVTNSIGNAIVYDDQAFDWEGDDYALPPWNELVLYEMHIGTFNDENPDGPGTFYSSTERLDYLRDLGVNVLCLMPLAEFPGDYSWGYNPAHPFAVESAYGGPDGLKHFIKEAHARGMAVVLDVVYNHFGPSDIDLWNFDGWSENGYGGIYFYNDHRADTPWGHTRPDYGRVEVRNYIRDNALMWLESFRADGLRWDGTVFIRRTTFSGGEEVPEGWKLMQDVNREIRERMPRKLLIAEDLQRDPTMNQPVEEGGAGFHAQWDTEFVYKLRESVLLKHEDEHREVSAVEHALTNRYSDDAFTRIIYIESHDNAANGSARLVCEIDPEGSRSWAAKKMAALGAVLTLTAPGIPMLFQGQEFLEEKWFSDTDPLDWEKLKTNGGLFELHKDLIRLRRNLDARTRGLEGQHLAMLHLDHEAKIVAFHRWTEGGPLDDTVILLNFTHEPWEGHLKFPHPGMWRVRFNSDWSGYSDAFANHEAVDVEAVGDEPGAIVSVGSYSAVIYSQDAE